MRNDMKELLKLGKWYDPWGQEDTKWKGDPKDAPKSERMRSTRSKFRHGGRVGPLRKYLHKQVGRIWDQVWSDICEVADIKTDSGRRLREAVWWEVDKTVFLEDGVPHTTGYVWGAFSYPYYGLYIHPETGILEESKRTPNKKETKQLTKFIQHGCKFEKLDGFWYQVWYELHDSHSIYRLPKEYVAKKQQLNANQLRDLHIKNDNQKE